MRKKPSLHHYCHILGIVLLLLSAGCSQLWPNAKTSQTEINVAAAANLSDVFAEVAKQFTAQTGIRVVYSFGATADLEKQIENGAPFDVFAAADVEHIDKLDREGLLTSGTRAIYARGRLVMWVPAGSHIQLAKIEDITGSEVERIAIAKPDIAPYGLATVFALRKLNIWERVEAKVVYGQNVLQAKQYAATGNAEVAFIPLALLKPGEGNYLEVDSSLHQPIDQALAVIKNSEKQAAARRFTSFVLSSEGQALLTRSGYNRPPTTSTYLPPPGSAKN